MSVDWTLLWNRKLQWIISALGQRDSHNRFIFPFFQTDPRMFIKLTVQRGKGNDFKRICHKKRHRAWHSGDIDIRLFTGPAGKTAGRNCVDSQA